MQTTKKDWLNDALAEANCFVSGHASTQNFIGIPCKAEVRYATLNSGSLMFFLTVSPFEEDYRAAYIKAFKTGSLGWLRSVFQPVIQLFYREGDEDFDVFFRHTATFKRLSFEKLAELVARYDKNFTSSPGTAKEINTSVNDIFQVWTRKYLSTFAVVSDLDAFTFNMHEAVFFELKRVKESLETWLPYIDDNRNYATLNKIAADRGGTAITLGYRTEDAGIVSVHRFLNPKNRESITGKKIIVDVHEAVTQPLLLDFSTVDEYTSTNKRQR